MKRGEKKAQLALVFIIAIIIVTAGILAYFLLKPKEKPKYPEEILKVEESYIKCLTDIGERAKNILMQKGGYIYDKSSEAEGLYLGNNLNFMGEDIAYWIYYDSSGIIKTQNPSLEDMENEISKFIEDNLDICDSVFDEYNVSYIKNVKKIEVKIRSNKIEVTAYIDLVIKKENKANLIREHKFFIKSNLKQLYENAIRIYEYEKSKRFLENYTIDIISLYGKTTGFEIQCYPLIFDKEELKRNITDGLIVNIERIKFNGNYFKFREGHKYFINRIDIDDGISVNLLYSKLFPTKIDIYAEEKNNLLKFDPIGNQEGLNLINFCYVPYHIVYDVKFPVLFILRKDDEIFKFPLVVVIERNGIKEILMENESIKTKGICNAAIKNAEIYVYDSENKKIDGADVYIKCLDANCYLGKTKNGYLKAKVPQCINAFILVNAENYEENKIPINTNYDVNVNIFLDKLYEKEIKLNLNEKETVIILFEGKRNDVINYPERNKLYLSRGNYNITLYVFKDKEIIINEKSEICYDTPLFLWIKRKKCEEIDQITFDKVLIGGGKSEIYFDEEFLEDYKPIEIIFDRFDEPKNIEDIQKNYEFLKFSKIEIK